MDRVETSTEGAALCQSRRSAAPSAPIAILFSYPGQAAGPTPCRLLGPKVHSRVPFDPQKKCLFFFMQNFLENLKTINGNSSINGIHSNQATTVPDLPGEIFRNHAGCREREIGMDTSIDSVSFKAGINIIFHPD